MAQITQSELEQIYQEELGRAPDTSGLSTYLDPAKGYSAEDVRGFVQGSTEKFLRNLGDWKTKGQEWYDAGYGLGDEFSASSAGDVVLLKSGQNVGDEYEDVTELMGGYVPEGYRAFYDKGAGGGGLFGTADRILGTNFADEGSVLNRAGKLAAATAMAGIPVVGWGSAAGLASSALGVNEGLLLTDMETLNVGTRLIGGEQMHKKSTAVAAENLGVTPEEFDMYADTAAAVGVGIASVATGGLGLFLAPAFTAIQGSAKRVGGTYAEREATSWGDVAQNTAIQTAIAGLGYLGPLGGGLGKLTETESVLGQAAVAGTAARIRGGGSWKGAGVAAATTSAGLAGAAPAAIAAGAGELVMGGTPQNAAIAAGSSAATSYVGGRNWSIGSTAAAALGINLTAGLVQMDGGGKSQQANVLFQSIENAGRLGFSGGKETEWWKTPTWR